MKHCWCILAAMVLFSSAVHAQKKGARDLITAETEKAIDAGLAKLTAAQGPDGSWGNNFPYRVGVTSLVGLAYLAGPPRPENAKPLGKAVAYVLSKQDLQGHLGQRGGGAYGHGYAMLFLADVYENLSDKKQKDDVKAALERASKLLIDGQTPAGGWRYNLTKVGGDDISITSVQLQALCAARNVGIDIPAATIDKAVGYLKSSQLKDSGGFPYLKTGRAPTLACSAAALTALNRAGVKDDLVFNPGMKYVQKFDPKTSTRHFFYGHHYAAKMSWLAGEKEFEKWYPPIRDDLLRKQRKDDQWLDNSSTNEVHLSTAMALIILQMPHGKLPSMKR